MKTEIEDKLYNDIKNYCSLNNLDVTEIINKSLKNGYMLEKYGERPGINTYIKNDEQVTQERKLKVEWNPEVVEEVKHIQNEIDNIINDNKGKIPEIPITKPTYVISQPNPVYITEENEEITTENKNIGQTAKKPRKRKLR